MQGKSFASYLTDDKSESRHRDSVLTEYYNAAPFYFCIRPNATMLRTETHKIVVYHGCEPGELFDMQTDPDEKHNLWNDPAMISTKTELLKQLCDRMAWTADPLPERTGNW
jgi:arylsulfatase